MSIVRMLKSFAAAALAVAASAVSAAEVISINFTQDGYGALKGDTVYANLADASITGSAWNTFSGASSGGVSGTYTLTKYWDGTQAKSDGTAVVSYEAKNMWHQSGMAEPYVGYLDDGEHNGVKGPTVSVTGIPYDVYDVIVYVNTTDSKFRPVTVNGFSYSYVDGSTVKGSTANWGTRQDVLAEGKNAMRITGLTGNLSIQGGSNDGARGCIAAVQIVKNTTAVVVPATDFKYLSGQGNVIETSSANWYSDEKYAAKWHWDHDVYRERIAYGRNAYSVLHGDHNYHPGTDVQWTNMTAFTAAFIVDVTDMTYGDDYWKVIACMGGITDTDRSLVLFKDPDGGVSLRPRTLGTDMDDYVLTIPASEISQGYHLFVVTCDTDGQKTTLRMDDGSAKTMDYAVQPTVGFQIGKNWNGARPTMWGYGDGLGVYAVFGWEKVLTSEQIALLYADYADALGTPVNYNFTSDFNNGHDTGVLYIPTMMGDNALQGTRGTIEIPTNSVVSVPSVCLGNSGTKYNYTFNVRGTLNVTSASTTYNVYSEKGSKRGILFGHWAGTGVENIYGTLNAPDAWLETTYTHDPETLNIIGGTVKVRGIYAPNGKSSATLSGGGVLETSELRLSGAWPLTCGDGTIRAVRYDSSSTGIVHNNGAVTFTDTAAGTTLDPNGLAISFAGTVTGSGKIVVDDSSENADGTVSFALMSGHSGPVQVVSGTLDIGSSRPTGEFSFAAGTKFVLSESVADGKNRVALTIAAASAAPEVTMYRADGVTPVAATVETDAQTGLKYIAYETAVDPVVSGEACWIAYEFENRSRASSGRDKTGLTYDGEGIRMQYEGQSTDNDYKDDHSLYTASRCYRDIVYPETWAAAVYATIPEIENAALMTFGTNARGLIGLIAGDTTKNEVLLVRTTGNSQYTKLATMTVPNAYSTPHLYIFSKTARKIEVYLDGTLWTTYMADEDITFGNGFQIGSVHGTVGKTGILNFKASADEEDSLYYLGDTVQNSFIGMLRLYDTTLSSSAAEALAEEFPYDSPNGTYTRTVAADGSWASADAWTSDGATCDAPAENAVVEITADENSTLTVGEEGSLVAVRLESLKIDGDASLTLAAAQGSSLVNTGRTIVGTDATVTPGVSISGGPLALAAGKTLTFDYRGYDLALDAPNGALQLTGVCSGDEDIEFIPPSDAKGRTFTLAFNTATQCWEARYARGAYTLRYVGPAEGDWSALDVWVVDGSSTPAAFLEGDSVVFGATASETVTVSISTAVNVGGITFESQDATTYTLNGTLNVDGAPLTVAGNAAIADLRGTAGAVSLTAPEVSLGTGGTLDITTAATVGAATKLTIVGGNGTIAYTGGGTAFAGQLEVKQGTFYVDCSFRQVIATEENPIKVTGTGTLYLFSDSNTHTRLPQGAYVVVDGVGAKLQVRGNNPFDRESEANSPRIICRNGGMFQTDGARDSYDVRVWDVQLDSGNLYFSGTTANYASRGLVIDGGTLHSSGESRLYRQANSPNRLAVAEINVADGTLSCELMTDGNLVKTGAGKLILGGNNGGAYTGVVDIREGTLVASAELQNVEVNKTVVMAAGTSLEIPADIALPFAIPDGQTWTLTGRSTLLLDADDVRPGSKVVSWTQGNAPTGRFTARTADGKIFSVLMREDGAYLTSGFMLKLR